MGVLCETAEKSGLTKKGDKSTAVKLKEVPANVGLPKKEGQKRKMTDSPIKVDFF